MKDKLCSIRLKLSLSLCIVVEGRLPELISPSSHNPTKKITAASGFRQDKDLENIPCSSCILMGLLKSLYPLLSEHLLMLQISETSHGL